MILYVTYLLLIKINYIGVILGGYEGCAFKNGGLYPPTFKRYKRLSFELKLHRNAWAAAAHRVTVL